MSSQVKAAIIASVALIAAACSTTPQISDSSFGVWPPPPERARVVYETSLLGSSSLASSSTTWISMLQGENAEEVSSLVKPYDVGAYGGLIAVSDTRARVVFVFDVPRRRFFPIGWRNDGQFAQPLGVAVDSARNIFVADGKQNRVNVYDAMGHYVRSVGEPEQFSRLVDVAVDPARTKIYLLDRGGVDNEWHRVRVYDYQTGAYLHSIGRRGAVDGEFNHPTQIAVSGENEIFVLDSGNFCVQVFDEHGAFLRRFGKIGDGLGQFARARGLAVSHEGLVFVSDGAFQNVQIYSKNGELLLAVGQSGDGKKPGEFLLPAGIAIDETQRIYVVDQLLRKVEVLKLLSENNKRER